MYILQISNIDHHSLDNSFILSFIDMKRPFTSFALEAEIYIVLESSNELDEMRIFHFPESLEIGRAHV